MMARKMMASIISTSGKTRGEARVSPTSLRPKRLYAGGAGSWPSYSPSVEMMLAIIFPSLSLFPDLVSD